MRTLALFVVAVALAAGLVQAQAPTLPPAQQCEVDRVALQDQVVQLRAQLVAAQTQIDRQALAAERARIEGTLPKLDGQRWDWTQLRYVPVSPGERGKP